MNGVSLIRPDTADSFTYAFFPSSKLPSLDSVEPSDWKSSMTIRGAQGVGRGSLDGVGGVVVVRSFRGGAGLSGAVEASSGTQTLSLSIEREVRKGFFIFVRA